ncbi:MAG: cell division protein FtsK [Burkholderiales bacterium]|nr:cell division protein FtsK [Burkholderiales bacterium]
MVDDELPEPESPPSPRSDAASAASAKAHGAEAPQDNVVSLKAKRGGSRREEAAKGAARGDSATTSGPPTPPKSAVAQPSGDGGGKAAPAKKTEKTIDWGKFNGLCENFVLIYGTDTVWDATERLIMKIANMGHAHGSDMVRMWKGSERRRTVRQSDVVFDPTMKVDPETTVNLFDGLAMEPVAGNVDPMLDLIRFLTSRASDNADACEEVMHWLLCWLAYPLQRPGAKLRTSVVMHGDEGAGKNFLFDTVVSIYGKYGALVGQDELEDKFNDWRSCKLFVVGDEVSSRAELVHNKNRLKALITSPTVQINPKNLPRREETNHINIVFLSNELQPLALDNSDRRYLVVYTPRAKGFEYYKALSAWRENGGVEAFMHYLMNYPLDDFNPYAPAPITDAKVALIGLNRKSPELFWQEWSGGELDLPYSSCSMAQAYQAYLKWCQRTGERYPFKREQFTPTVLRFSEANDRPTRVKPMKLATVGAKKVERMFLVVEPPDERQGDWATDCVSAFEEHLKVYLGWTPRSPGERESGPGGDE